MSLVSLSLDDKDKENFTELQQSIGQAQQELAQLTNKLRVRVGEAQGPLQPLAPADPIPIPSLPRHPPHRPFPSPSPPSPPFPPFPPLGRPREGGDRVGPPGEAHGKEGGGVRGGEGGEGHAIIL